MNCLLSVTSTRITEDFSKVLISVLFKTLDRKYFFPQHQKSLLKDFEQAACLAGLSVGIHYFLYLQRSGKASTEFVGYFEPLWYLHYSDYSLLIYVSRNLKLVSKSNRLLLHIYCNPGDTYTGKLNRIRLWS